MDRPSGREQSLSRYIERLEARMTGLADEDATPTPTEHLLAELASAHEELLVADEEVRAQQEELDRLMQGAGENQQGLERFLSSLPASVLITNDSGSIIFGNAAAAAFLGAGTDRLLGKPLMAFVEPSDRKTVRDMVTAAGAGIPQRQTAVLRTRVGGAVTVELVATLQPLPGAPQPRITWALISAPAARSRPPGCRWLRRCWTSVGLPPRAATAGSCSRR